jgi:hypothetical protein
VLEPEFPTGNPVEDFANARFVQSWSCEIDENDGNGSRFVDIQGIAPSFLNQHATSGGSILNVTGSVINGNKLSVPHHATVQIEDVASSRRLAPSSGSLKTLIVRVTGTYANGTLVSPTASAAQLINDVFDDDSCLATQYARCSNGALTISKPTNPVMEVTITTDPTGTTPNAATVKGWLENNATNQAGDLSAYDLVMFCQPPGNTGWYGYAYINAKTSFFNNEWCQYVTSQMHEVGHNLVRHV